MSRAITFEPHSHGALLTEVTRAFASQACPSALLKRLEAGIAQAAAETASAEDRAFLEVFRRTLEAMSVAWRIRETAHYAACEAAQ